MSEHSADYDRTPRSAAALDEHLRHHLTDGAWHDRCEFCLNRRRCGGNGTTVIASAVRQDGIEPPTARV